MAIKPIQARTVIIGKNPTKVDAAVRSFRMRNPKSLPIPGHGDFHKSVAQQRTVCRMIFLLEDGKFPLNEFMHYICLYHGWDIAGDVDFPSISFMRSDYSGEDMGVDVEMYYRSLIRKRGRAFMLPLSKNTVKVWTKFEDQDSAYVNVVARKTGGLLGKFFG